MCRDECNEVRPVTPYDAFQRVTLSLPIAAAPEDDADDDDADVADFDPQPGAILFHKKTGARIRIINMDTVSVITGYAFGARPYKTTQHTVWIVEHESRSYYLGHHEPGQVRNVSAHELLDYLPVQVGEDR